MKRLISTLVCFFSVILLTSSASAVTRYWTVDIYEPSATTNKTLNVEYKVFSTDGTDQFNAELFENNVSKGTQSITHPNGNSGVFNITIPSAGTYSYFVRATNSNVVTPKDSKTVSINVSNAPEPTVTTVTVQQNTGGAGGVGGGTGAGGAQAGVAQPAVAGAETTTPQTSATATTTPANNQGVLGAEAAKNRTQAQKNRNKYLIPSALFVVLAGAGYYLYRKRMLANE